MARNSDRIRREGSPMGGAEPGIGVTLLPMLVGSLILIVFGMILVTTLV